MPMEIRDIPILSLTKTGLVERIHMEWDLLQRVVQPLDSAAVLAQDPGGWSVKDHLAHIAVWERFLCRHFFHQLPAYQAVGMDESDWRKGSEDQWNAWIHAQYQDLPYKQVLALSRQAHDQVLSDLESLTDEDLRCPQTDLAGDENQLIFAVVWNTYEHYCEHRLTIEKIISPKR